jgi:hypothetical protein
MADLKSLFAKKATPDGGQTTSGGAGSDAAGALDSKGLGPSESGTEPLPRPVQASQGTTRGPANPFAKKSSSGSGDSSGQSASVPAASVGDDSGSSEPKSGLRALSVSAGARDSSGDPGSVASPPISSLDALDSSADEGIAPRESVTTYFADETPAVKPTRELPADMTKEQLGFIDTVDSVYEIIHDPDLLGGVIRNIMIELKSNAEYIKLMAPEDIRTMVRGMRESMGLARVKKQETKAKRASGASKKSKALDDDILAGLDDILAGSGIS